MEFGAENWHGGPDMHPKDDKRKICVAEAPNLILSHDLGRGYVRMLDISAKSRYIPSQQQTRNVQHSNEPLFVS